MLCFQTPTSFACKWSDTLSFWENHLKGTSIPCASNSPFISSVYWFWYTLRCAEVLFPSVLTPLAREVVSVVDQFSNVSEVNILCITQVCKCLHYNTSFSSATYTERCLPPESRLQPRSADEPWRPPHLLSPAPAGLWRRWQHKSASHWGLGSHFVGHWAVAKAATPCHSDPAPLTPTATLTLTAVVSANIEMEQVLGGNKMHLFSTISARLPPPPPPPNPC